MLRRAHAHSVRWTLGRCRHSMLYRYRLWTEVPPLWSFKIVHNVLTSKQLYSWRLLIWELLAAPLDMGKDVQVEQELPAGSSAAASCWCDPAEVGTQTHRTAQPGGHTGVTAQHSTAKHSSAQPEGLAGWAAHHSVALCLLMQAEMWITSSSI